MSPRLRLCHEWMRHLTTLLPTTRITQVRPLALFALGLLWAGQVTQRAIAAALPLAVADASSERRLQRWLANSRVVPARLWNGLLPHLLASRAGQDLLLVLDPTPHAGTAIVLELGLICRKRTLPVAWRVVPQHVPWPEAQASYFRAMVADVAAALPAGCTVTVIGDRGLPSAELVDLCHAHGFDVLLRLSADTNQSYHVRLADGTICPVWDLVTGPGQRWAGPVELFKKAGWRALYLTIRWDRGHDVPWLLASTRPGGAARVRDYRRRAHAEATYEDCKSRGFAVTASRIIALDRLDRLLLLLHLALWWGIQLGLRVIRQGERWRYDRRGRRDLSLLRLGRAALADWLDRLLRLPPLPFHGTPAGLVFTWLA